MSITVRVNYNKSIVLGKSESLLEGLQREKIPVSVACGGRGRCGKCKIHLISGSMPPSEEDVKFFSEEEIIDGMRLSCMAYPKENIEIELEECVEDDIKAVAGFFDQEALKKLSSEDSMLAIDIGTTTIAMAFLPCESKSVITYYTGINHQRSYGADVIARIAAASEGKALELTSSIRGDINSGINILLDNFEANGLKVIVTGNTTMEHLLLGYDVRGLGQFPFTPVNIKETKWKSDELSLCKDEHLVTVMPGFSTYVGADIAAGVISCGLYKSGKPSMLIDLGTNGEMALQTGDVLLVTSTAAGPAFEGGNISCGMPGISGAISHAVYNGSIFEVETIGGGVPVGICGSGLIEVVAELVKAELIDETGRLDEDAFEDEVVLYEGDKGKVVLTQKDIRELQLAKSAVRAGMETLIKKAGLTILDIDRIYLAGGFGLYLNIESAVEIGLLPREALGKIVVAGNSALAGALMYGCNEKLANEAKRFISGAKEVDLSTDKDFNNAYMEYMMFE